ncbi:hypothetical protein BCR35DRAFT_333829 [Leucosporidium creatinivorum]|uniref:Uncharacterized protein n=1 Tax=Leucosporidium creatinivorum TaxID=106004 RepID=A0A1Y2ENG6_9BASI|nr:hypothetical protein BCR35DRAFT_333829 [Leucosporidium creatinivorum]
MDFHPPFNTTSDDPNAPPPDISPGLSVLLFVVLPIAAVVLLTGVLWAYLSCRSRRQRKEATNPKTRDGKLVRRADIVLQEREVDDGRLGDTEAAFNLKLADLELGERTDSTEPIPPPYDPAISGAARVA